MHTSELIEMNKELTFKDLVKRQMGMSFKLAVMCEDKFKKENE